MAEDTINQPAPTERKRGLSTTEKIIKVGQACAVIGISGAVGHHLGASPDAAVALASTTAFSLYMAPEVARQTANKIKQWVENKTNQAQNIADTVSERASIWASRNLPARPGLREELAETKQTAQVKDTESQREIRSLQRQISELERANEANLQRGDIIASVAVDLAGGDFGHVAALARKIDVQEAEDAGIRFDETLKRQNMRAAEKARENNHKGKNRRDQKRAS